MKDKQHSSDYELLVAHKDSSPLPMLKFNLEEWEIRESNKLQINKYERCVTNQLNIEFDMNRSLALGSTRVEIPTVYEGVQMYEASLKECLVPHTIINNYHEFHKQFDHTAFGKHSFNLKGYKREIETAQCLVDVLMSAEAAYKQLIRMFSDNKIFNELYDHKHSKSMYHKMEYILAIWNTGLCYVVNEAHNSSITAEFEKLVSKYCSNHEYFKDNKGFMPHYSQQGIDLPRCIEACEVRLELIDLLKTDLENMEED